MSHPANAQLPQIQRIERIGCWFDIHYDGTPRLDGLGRRKDDKHGVALAAPGFKTARSRDDQYLAVVRFLYDKKIGQLGCLWRHEGTPIAFKYANVKFGDLFDFYTTPDGVLRWPEWSSMRLAVDEFLEEQEPRAKFHPSRVQQFINENGIDQLELME